MSIAQFSAQGVKERLESVKNVSLGTTYKEKPKSAGSSVHAQISIEKPRQYAKTAQNSARNAQTYQETAIHAKKGSNSNENNLLNVRENAAQGSIGRRTTPARAAGMAASTV